MIKAILIISACITLLFGCATAGNSKTTILPVDFSAKQYNSISKQYIDSLTVVDYTLMNNGKSWLAIRMDAYGKDAYGQQNNVLTTFVKEHCTEYIALIDKYLEWEQTATRDGDLLSKPIGKAMGQIFNMHFNFHSGNTTTHYLSIGLWGSDSQYFDKTGAKSLRALLVKYQNGELKAVDTDQKYQ